MTKKIINLELPSHWHLPSTVKVVKNYVNVCRYSEFLHQLESKPTCHENDAVETIPNMLSNIKYHLNFNVVQQFTTMIKGCHSTNGLAFRLNKVHKLWRGKIWLDIANYKMNPERNHAVIMCTMVVRGKTVYINKDKVQLSWESFWQKRVHLIRPLLMVQCQLPACLQC